ncbi:Aste57867_18953 [Aphanomyces stellatus]|uniref:Aste57867_18953 protein n=1 Tax=Aphanomyces stellatus TaxID=120398 RepID=A0A485LC14_9STRA|nr:hypothetical protein As57867_018889 [Aphanomyces stellatus]VFT95683.1 Aste57867_18953 [Aphanomyces stellatus]
MSCDLVSRRVRAGLVQVFPILEWLPAYPWRTHLAHDAAAALVVACVTLPQEFAFAASMHLPTATSLRTAIVAPFIYCLCGTSSTLSFANAAELTWAVGGVLHSPDNDATEAERITKSMALTCTSGVVLLLLGSLNLGARLAFMPRAVLGGVLWGGSLAVLVKHAPHVVGLDDLRVALWHAEACVLGLASVALLVASHVVVVGRRGGSRPAAARVRPSSSSLQADTAATPSALPPLPRAISFVGTAKAFMLSSLSSAWPDMAPLAVCGLGFYVSLMTPLPAAVPSASVVHGGINSSSSSSSSHVNQHVHDTLTLSHALDHIVSQEVTEMLELAWNACTIALTTYVSTIVLVYHGARRRHVVLATSKSPHHHPMAQTQQQHLHLESPALDVDPNKELVAYGLASVVGGAFQSLPPAGGLARTAINAHYGRSLVTTLCTTLFLLIAVAVDLYPQLPLPSLAAIVVVSVAAFLDTDELVTMARCRLYQDMALWVVVCGTTLVGGIVMGALAAVVASGATSDAVVVDALDENNLRDVVVVCRVRAAALCFANWDAIEKHVLAVVALDDVGQHPKGVVLDLSHLVDGRHDTETVARLGVLRQHLKRHDVEFAISHAPPSLASALDGTGIATRLAGQCADHATDSAVQAIHQGLLV